MPGQACIFKAFRASFTLVAARYIGAGDPKGGGDLPLRQGNGAAQSIAQPHDPCRPVGKALIHQLPQPGCVVPVVEIIQHGVLHPDDIHKLQGVPLPIGFDGIRKRDFSLKFFLAAKIHQDLIFNAAGGVSGQTCPLGGIKGGDGLDQPNGADRDQILLITGLGVIFFEGQKQKERRLSKLPDKPAAKLS